MMSGAEDDEDEDENDEDFDEYDDVEEPDEVDDEEVKDAPAVNTNMNFVFEDVDDEEDEENDDEDEKYLQKFEEEMKKNIIEDFHPEMKVHNYDEINVLSKVIRDKNGRIIDPLHQTLPFITKYEKARILGERAKQINSGATPLVDVPPEMIDGYLIALKEFQEKKIPFIIKRPVSLNHIEYWKLSDLEII